MNFRKKQKPKNIRLEKKQPPRSKIRINYRTLNIILIILLLILIFFVLIPLLIYQMGSLDSTNYYYRIKSVVAVAPILLT